MFQFNKFKNRKDSHYDNVNWDNVYVTQKNAPRRRRRQTGVYLKSLLCALIIGGVAGSMVFGSFAIGKNVYGNTGTQQTIATTTSRASQTSQASQASQTAQSQQDTSGEPVSGSASVAEGMTVSEIADLCTSSVVAITNKSVSETMQMFGQSGEMESAGSGVIIGKNDDELLIATNYHVIEGADTLTICFNDSEDAVYDANIKGTDASNDLAVVAVSLSDIDDKVLKNVTIASFAEADSASVGDQVVAIGNALGYGQSVTSGYISALDKEVQMDETSSSTLLQTDAAINPGNSGGALFNMNGELIGINTAKYSDTTVEGMGFAIPISRAEPILEKLMTEETKSKLSSGYGHLGISGQDVDAETSETYGLPQGIYVSQVSAGSCAQAAGLQKGDIITSFNGQSVSSLSELKNLLQYYEAGTKVELTYARNNNGSYEETTVSVTLDDASEAATQEQSGSESGNVQQNENTQQNGSSWFNFFGGNNGSSSEDSYNEDTEDSFYDGSEGYANEDPRQMPGNSRQDEFPGGSDSYGNGSDSYGSGSFGNGSDGYSSTNPFGGSALEDFFNSLW